MTETSPTTPLEAFRQKLVRTTNAAVDDGELTSERAARALATLGVHVTQTLAENPDACSKTCLVCNSYELAIDHTDPLPDGTTLDAYKHQVFELVVNLRHDLGWCQEGTLEALEAIGVPAEDADDGGEGIRYTGPVRMTYADVLARLTPLVEARPDNRPPCAYFAQEIHSGGDASAVPPLCVVGTAFADELRPVIAAAPSRNSRRIGTLLDEGLVPGLAFTPKAKALLVAVQRNQDAHFTWAQALEGAVAYVAAQNPTDV